jgi:hypothetical protein
MSLKYMYENNNKIAVFRSIEEFKQELPHYTKDIEIYIDSDLGEGLTGQQYAKQLYNQGFKNLYLVTGYGKSHFPEMYWFKDILPKEHYNELGDC